MCRLPFLVQVSKNNKYIHYNLILLNLIIGPSTTYIYSNTQNIIRIAHSKQNQNMSKKIFFVVFPISKINHISPTIIVIKFFIQIFWMMRFSLRPDYYPVRLLLLQVCILSCLLCLCTEFG